MEQAIIGLIILIFGGLQT